MKLGEFVTKVIEELSQAGKLPAGDSLVVQFDLGVAGGGGEIGVIDAPGASAPCRLRFSIPIKQEPKSNQ